MFSYYTCILAVGVANLVFAAVAYLQRAQQIRGNRVRERQLRLAEARNTLAERRLRRLDDQVALLAQIRDAVCAGRQPPTVGVLDVGSGTAKLAVCRYDPQLGSFEQVRKHGVYTALGAEIERHGEYGSATLARLSECLRELAQESADAGCERLAVVVTAPGRSGRNSHELLRAVHRATGQVPRLLSPEDEARLAFAGATMAPAALTAKSAFVCDVGGGSTEVAVGSPLDGTVAASASFDVGAVVLAERHFRHDPPTASELSAAREEARSTLDLQGMGSAATAAFATGGSARALARVVGPVIGADELVEALARVASSDLEPVNPRRRRSLPAGIVILEVLQSAVGLPLTVVPGGLREGVLLQLAGAHRAAAA